MSEGRGRWGGPVRAGTGAELGGVGRFGPDDRRAERAFAGASRTVNVRHGERVSRFDPSEEAPINGVLGDSITYRIATEPREGQQAFTLQTLPGDPGRSRANVAEASGFSLHAGVWAKSREREKVEHLARYISRPPIATERLAQTDSGQVRYTLKTPYRVETTHVIFKPEDFIARLAALAPKPRAHSPRYHGVFA